MIKEEMIQEFMTRERSVGVCPKCGRVLPNTTMFNTTCDSCTMDQRAELKLQKAMKK